MARQPAPKVPEGRLYRFDMVVEYTTMDYRTKEPKRTTTKITGVKHDNQTYKSLRSVRQGVSYAKGMYRGRGYDDAAPPLFTVNIFYVDPNFWVLQEHTTDLVIQEAEDFVEQLHGTLVP